MRIRLLVDAARRLGLDGADRVADVPVERLARSYNGIGPSWLPARLVRFVTDAYPEFEPAALIHDWDYDCSGGDRELLLEANDRFYANCRRSARRTYPWWRPRRWRLLSTAKVWRALLGYATTALFSLVLCFVLSAGLSAGCRSAFAQPDGDSFPQTERWWK